MLPVRLRGAKTHNLRSIDLDLPPGQFVVLTGPSGSGKSSLAIDTLYAEGQRRFVESFSPYARQFLERMERPPVDELSPIAATVAVERRTAVKSSRSTLATMTDIEPYLAALFGRIALPFCPSCDQEARPLSAHAAATQIAERGEEKGGTRALVSYPASFNGTQSFLDLRESLVAEGYRRLIVGGGLREIDSVSPSEAAAAEGPVEVVVDRLRATKAEVPRLSEAVEAAWHRAEGRANVRLAGDASESPWILSEGLSCPNCGRIFDPPRATLFSYNSPHGACEPCRGFGRVIDVDWDKVVPDSRKTLQKGAIRPWNGKSSETERKLLAQYCRRQSIPMDTPWSDLGEAQRQAVIEGEGTWSNGKYPGVRAWFKWLESRAYKMHVRVLLSRYREYSTCKACEGSRLNSTARQYRVAELDLGAWHTLTVREAHARLTALRVDDPQGERAKGQLLARLRYLTDVGLSYVTLDRASRTLSGGETQRANLTTALGAELEGTLFVLDEPTVGLHAADVPPLTDAIRRLAETGNTVLVVEHDAAVVKQADRVIELGPGGGIHGGTILFDGPPEDLQDSPDLPTAKAWATSMSEARIPRTPKRWLRIRGARANNLRGETISFPLGVFCALTGRSGSGKSTLAVSILYRALAGRLDLPDAGKPAEHDGIDGVDGLTSVVLVDQTPLGRTARGNAATYTKAWDRVRALFASEPVSVRQGFTASHFSFNAPDGRCAACSGEGYETIEMQFLADVQVLCATCRGKRFRPDVLAVTHRGRSIADILAMTVEEALAFFGEGTSSLPIVRALSPLLAIGLGYLPLGQPLSTLSGGEAQRLKLSRALAEAAPGAIFIIDEPSAGLHATDTRAVVDALDALVEKGASVVVVEHDLDVIARADWIVDLGPGSGPEGGRVVAEGPPEVLLSSPFATGIALRARREGGGFRDRAPAKAPREPTAIQVFHAREHNLKDISCAIPHDALVVVTGPSGSGKSSLAFDVVFAEGQRRFMETLSPYSRHFLPVLPRPNVESVIGVPPSIALEQGSARAGVNSTVATVTEIAHYLRLLFAKLGELHCPKCDAVVGTARGEELYDQASKLMRGRGQWTLFAPAVRARKGAHQDIFAAAFRDGFVEARVDDRVVPTDPPPRLAKTKEHTIELVVFSGQAREVTRELFDRALGWGDGVVRLQKGPASDESADAGHTLSSKRACVTCGIGIPDLDPRWFSFNTKQGQCETCEGVGGDCKACEGTRLAPIPRRVRLFGHTYAEMSSFDVGTALRETAAWRFDGTAEQIGKAPLAELLRRLRFVNDVGLHYLTLGRSAATLSGGELQRLRLSAQLGSGLTGALYVLDEPTIGLHPQDTARLIRNIRGLVNTGSTVLIVEHDAEVIRAADYLIDMGPGGGQDGGTIAAQGAAKAVLKNEHSPTARALQRRHGVERKAIVVGKEWVELQGARAQNLKNLAFRVPVSRMTVVCGVSGSGKSTLVRHVFFPAVRRALGLVTDPPGAHDSVRGYKSLKRVVAVDQAPIGRTPRSVPATFLGIWDPIRSLYASLPDSKVRGYDGTRFSFNTPKGGRCPTCEGQGAIVSEMSFLPDVVTTCEACRGMRFEPGTNSVRFQGTSIGELLQKTAREALALFTNHPKIARPLQMMDELGIGYLQLGQGSNTLSGGEAQRLKLAAELTPGVSHEPTLYVLDEPTTGLHLSDVSRLIRALDRLVQRGDTLVVIEHHPDVIANADWVVELGPEAGSAGGEIVFAGAPPDLVRAKTATGRFLARR